MFDERYLKLFNYVVKNATHLPRELTYCFVFHDEEDRVDYEYYEWYLTTDMDFKSVYALSVIANAVIMKMDYLFDDCHIVSNNMKTHTEKFKQLFSKIETTLGLEHEHLSVCNFDDENVLKKIFTLITFGVSTKCPDFNDTVYLDLERGLWDDANARIKIREGDYLDADEEGEDEKEDEEKEDDNGDEECEDGDEEEEEEEEYVSYTVDTLKEMVEEYVNNMTIFDNDDATNFDSFVKVFATDRNYFIEKIVGGFIVNVDKTILVNHGHRAIFEINHIPVLIQVTESSRSLDGVHTTVTKSRLWEVESNKKYSLQTIVDEIQSFASRLNFHFNYIKSIHIFQNKRQLIIEPEWDVGVASTSHE